MRVTLHAKCLRISAHVLAAPVCDRTRENRCPAEAQTNSATTTTTTTAPAIATGESPASAKSRDVRQQQLRTAMQRLAVMSGCLPTALRHSAETLKKLRLTFNTDSNVCHEIENVSKLCSPIRVVFPGTRVDQHVCRSMHVL